MILTPGSPAGPAGPDLAVAPGLVAAPDLVTVPDLAAGLVRRQVDVRWTVLRDRLLTRALPTRTPARQVPGPRHRAERPGR